LDFGSDLADAVQSGAFQILVAKSQLVLLAMMPSSLLLADQLDSFL
jgi:hypothetical protein